MAAVGMILFMLGASAMDSNRLFVPVLMIGLGMSLIWAAGRRHA